MPPGKIEIHAIKAATVFRLSNLEKYLEEAIKGCERARLEIAKKLRTTRKDYGLSLREISKRLKLSAAYVSDVELGRRKLTVDFTDRFVEALTQQKRKGMK